MEVTGFPETSVTTYETTWCHNVNTIILIHTSVYKVDDLVRSNASSLVVREFPLIRASKPWSCTGTPWILQTGFIHFAFCASRVCQCKRQSSGLQIK